MVQVGTVGFACLAFPQERASPRSVRTEMRTLFPHLTLSGARAMHSLHGISLSTGDISTILSAQTDPMEPIMLHQVSINGSALSTLLQSLISLGRNVDGLLLGHVQTHVHTQFKDDDSGAPRRPCLADAHVMHSCTHLPVNVQGWRSDGPCGKAAHDEQCFSDMQALQPSRSIGPASCPPSAAQPRAASTMRWGTSRRRCCRGCCRRSNPGPPQGRSSS